jgi:hypothetical protein
MDILGMAEHGHDIVASPTPIMKPEVNLPFFNIFRAAPGGYMPIDMQFTMRGLVGPDEGVSAVGTGCIYISRRVMQKVRPLFAFPVDEWGCCTETEDMEFSRRVRAAGFPIYADFTRVSEHASTVGLYAMILKMLNAARKAVEASRAVA